MDDAQKTLSKSQSEAAATALKLSTAISNIDLASKGFDQARDQAALDKQQRAIDAKKENEDFNKKQSQTARDTDLDARIKQLEAKLETTPEVGKPAIRAELEKLNEEKALNKEKDDLAEGGPNALPELLKSIHDLYNAEIAKLRADLAAKQDKGENKGEVKGLSAVTAEATAAVKDSKHPELEEELKNLLAVAKSDPQAKILALLQVLAQTMAASHGQNAATIANLEKELHDLESKVIIHDAK